MKMVIKYGGSLLFKDGKINVDLIDNICDIVRELHEKGNEIGMVIGGGFTARQYISALNPYFAEAKKDYVAVLATRMNAMLFVSRLSDICCPKPPAHFEDILDCLGSGKMIVSGGMQPGQSTNAVATLLCEAMGARVLVNATNVDFIYDKDPKKYKDAVPITTMDYKGLKGIISNIDSTAGGYDMFDMVAAKNIERSGIELHFINGNDPENLYKIIDNVQVGTVVKG
ncbi:MAG TPA: UMP kinase [Candidatus Methanofastidiosa archaeon]|nr:UMP kinase [Candidatus Methanofastidiosa archaeon]